LRAWFYRELPADLQEAFEKAHPEGPGAVKDRVYEKGANAYLASFTQFLGENQQHSFIRRMVADCLGEFLDRHVAKYKSAQLRTIFRTSLMIAWRRGACSRAPLFGSLFIRSRIFIST
jgi:hypothetical protein